MSAKKLLLFACLLAALVFPAPAAATVIVNGYPDEAGRRTDDDDVKTVEHAGDYTLYTDYANGFSFRCPAGLTPDWSLSAVRTVFAADTTRIEIYRDDLRGTAAAAADFINYGNRFVIASPDHTILADEWLTSADGYSAHLLAWTRRPLAHVPGDKNNYASIEIVKNDLEVYTIFVKSSLPIDNANDILAGLTVFEPRGIARNYRRHAPATTPMNAETKAFYSRYFDDRAPLTWGIFEPSAPQTLGQLDVLEKRLDFSFPVLLHYQMFDEQFPAWGLDNAYRHGKYVELTLQTTRAGQVNALWATETGNAGMVYAILDGQYDDYFAAYADKLKEFGHPVLFRLNNEMNGDWCWYSAFYTGKDAELYQALWRYIHSVFVARGVENVIWVWNPHDVSLPAFKWNHYLAYYPGDEYVDVVGLTGYNNGTYFPGERWREFAEIYPALHNDYASHFDKPFMITEFSASSFGGDKVAWINGMFDQIRKLSRIKVAVWWSGVDFDQNGQPGRIYLIDENEQILDAFRERLKEYKSGQLPGIQNKSK